MTDKIASKIAIVGGGLSGASSLVQLVKIAAPKSLPLDITIFNATPEFATGLPYSSSVADRFLLNHESTDMGGLNVRGEAGVDDFYQWVQENRDRLQPLYPDFDLASPSEYVPRNLYGKYLKARYEEAKTFAKQHGINIHEVQATVSNVQPLRQKVEVTYAPKDGKSGTAHFDKVVLALGHAYAPGDSQSMVSGHYFKANEIGQLLASDKVKGKRVIIQGTGQYADEIALALLDAGAENVKMISRHGWMHAVRGQYKPYERQFLTIENLEARSGKDAPFKLRDVVDLLKQEMEHALGKPVDWKAVWAPENTADKLRHDIEVAESGAELKWRSVLLSLKGIRQEIFDRLDPDDRTRFTHEYRSLFFTYQAPIPVKIAKKLLRAMHEGRLQVIGGWQSSQWDPEKKQFRVGRVISSGGDHDATVSVDNANYEELRADYLVAASGQTLNPSHIPLLKTLLDNGSIQEAKSGGIRINKKNQHVVINDKDSDAIYALGPITNGERLISSNAHMCMDSAHIIAENMVNDLTRGHSSARDRATAGDAVGRA